MTQKSIPGTISISPYGRPVICLLPSQEPSRNGQPKEPTWFQCNDDDFVSIMMAHFDFLRCGLDRGRVHGRNTEVRTSTRTGKRFMNFQVGFLGITLVENLDLPGRKATFFIELPFSEGRQSRQQDETILHETESI